ncbi:bactofilin family protein [Parapedobacter indicus]|uniref:Protein CcmA, bactofilin family n=1 Tax=Parapedobacter indicus TaxID=1477437 RepID=A0A1I3U8R4_9SPHI|nr:polymer-forming cytoskeletal protein [Parapedobacter indicus]PPK99218.1 cytoskeletal protein CcmA (bactofilin family) [Parapedobacter indicus]SFJ79968.1 protein CcmA, bactofilin family [Parapedobacter indicus]
MNLKPKIDRQKSCKLPSTPTLISGDCTITGKIKSAHAIRIEGTLLGDIEEAGNVIISQSGLINGDIEAKSLIVFGHVHGNITALDSIEIKNSATVIGRLNATKLSVERGAVYDGNIAIGQVSIGSV